MIYEFIVAIIWVFIGLLLVNWIAHISMTIGDCKGGNWGWGNYWKFKREFRKLKWRKMDNYRSLVSNNQELVHLYDGYLHANIVKFRGIGMVINNPISYLLVTVFIRKEVRKRDLNNVRYKW